MKKLFKLLPLLSLVQELRGHRRHDRGYGHRRRSRDYYPLHHRGIRRTVADRLLGRLLHGRRY